MTCTRKINAHSVHPLYNRLMQLTLFDWSRPTVWIIALILLPAAAAQDVGTHLVAMDALLQQAEETSRTAQTAGSVMDVKAAADAVFTTVWGQTSGLLDHTGAARIHGWKTRWHTSGEEFDEDHVARHGNTPPSVSEITELGLMGHGRAVVRALTLREDEPHVHHVIASLSNVIGWMRLDDGVTKGERQPRIDLTHVWDAPSRFWNTTADTGWLGEVFAQALNILKTDYKNDLVLAHQHAAAMTALIEKCRMGVDENNDGSVSPAMMEGGLATALVHAGYGGLVQ